MANAGYKNPLVKAVLAGEVTLWQPAEGQGKPIVVIDDQYQREITDEEFDALVELSAEGLIHSMSADWQTEIPFGDGESWIVISPIPDAK